MLRLIIVFIVVLSSFISNVKANVISKAFSALKAYNYFEAKKLFEKIIQKETAAASYGLSIIYQRSDNPFSNIDVAYKFILNSESSFQLLTEKNKIIYLK